MDSLVKLCWMINFHTTNMMNNGPFVNHQIKMKFGYYYLKKFGVKYMAVIKELNMEYLMKFFNF
jgi:hypothetical protein